MLIKLGKNIRKERERQNKTQEKVSLDAGIEMSYFSKIERGEANPSLHIIYAIVRALNVDSSNILPF